MPAGQGVLQVHVGIAPVTEERVVVLAEDGGSLDGADTANLNTLVPLGYNASAVNLLVATSAKEGVVVLAIHYGWHLADDADGHAKPDYSCSFL